MEFNKRYTPSYFEKVTEWKYFPCKFGISKGEREKDLNIGTNQKKESEDDDQ